jgi:hypothetical protein
LLQVDGLVGFLLLALWFYCVVDVICTDASLVRNIPKMPWLFIVFLLPDLGSIAWLLFGRPQGTKFQPGSTDYAAPRRWLAPEDRPGFGTSPDLDSMSPVVRAREEAARIRVQEEQLRRREAELARREAELRRREKGDEPPK